MFHICTTALSWNGGEFSTSATIKDEWTDSKIGKIRWLNVDYLHDKWARYCKKVKRLCWDLWRQYVNDRYYIIFEKRLYQKKLYIYVNIHNIINSVLNWSIKMENKMNITNPRLHICTWGSILLISSFKIGLYNSE